MKILGIHGGVTCKQHDAAAALIIDGKIKLVCEEERFCRVKSARGHIPVYSMQAALKESGIHPSEIDLVVHCGATYPDLHKRISGYLRHYFGIDMPLLMVNHQDAHLATAYHCSGFDEAMCISYDGYGDKLSAAFAIGKNGELKVLETRPATNSLGVFYASITSFLGFTPIEDEYKVMGLASFGKPNYDLSPIAKPSSDGFITDHTYWDCDPEFLSTSEALYNPTKMSNLLGAPRSCLEPISQKHKDIAYAAQKSLEACIVSTIEYLHKKTGLRKLCLAGGVALNCSANRHIYELPFIDEIFIQPASSDRGLALGCAILGSIEKGVPVEPLDNAFKGGPIRTDEEIQKALDITGFAYEKLSNPSATAAALLKEGNVIGWFQGASEFGPRALGHRSILADPRKSEMRDKVNALIKFREEFRPFAPAVLEERAPELFHMKGKSPYMTIAFKVRDEWKDKIQAVTHIDGTARVQTVSKQTDPKFYNLISEFEKLTGVPVVLNTSFNVKGQPIVETPYNALETFAASGMYAVIMGSFLVKKDRIPTA